MPLNTEKSTSNKINSNNLRIYKKIKRYFAYTNKIFYICKNLIIVSDMKKVKLYVNIL